MWQSVPMFCEQEKLPSAEANHWFIKFSIVYSDLSGGFRVSGRGFPHRSLGDPFHWKWEVQARCTPYQFEGDPYCWASLTHTPTEESCHGLPPSPILRNSHRLSSHGLLISFSSKGPLNLKGPYVNS